jgi:hypothetical protein
LTRANLFLFYSSSSPAQGKLAAAFQKEAQKRPYRYSKTFPVPRQISLL